MSTDSTTLSWRPAVGVATCRPTVSNLPLLQLPVPHPHNALGHAQRLDRPPLLCPRRLRLRQVITSRRPATRRQAQRLRRPRGHITTRTPPVPAVARRRLIGRRHVVSRVTTSRSWRRRPDHAPPSLYRAPLETHRPVTWRAAAGAAVQRLTVPRRDIDDSRLGSKYYQLAAKLERTPALRIEYDRVRTYS